MSLLIKEEVQERQLLEEGVYTAVCCSIVDLGEVYSERYDKTQPKVLISWELPETKYLHDGEVRYKQLSREYTASLHEKAGLRAALEAWRGKAFTSEELQGFSLPKIIGTACQLQIVHETSNNGKTYQNIKSIMALPKATQIDHKITKPMIFDFDNADFESKEYNLLPEWIRKKIEASETYKNRTSTQEFTDVTDHYTPDDELPWD